jgi:dolichol-phosphate mannosyltransferase
MPNPFVSIIVPCLNEEECVPTLVERLRVLVEPRRWEVLFVNDGSTDRTGSLLDAAAARYPWARVCHHPQNMGLGAGIRTGFQNTTSPIVCTIDSDASYPPESLPKFVELIEQGADIVTASPWHPDNETAEGGWHRLILSRGVSWCYRCVTGAQLYTFTAMFRAYTREVVTTVGFESSGFPAVTELLIRALGQGFRVAEVAMPLIPREHGESKMSLKRAILGHLRLLTSAAKWAKHG